MDSEKAIKLIIQEFNQATKINGKFNSCHEGYAVILEELDELWDEIKKKTINRNTNKLCIEAKQTAAMAIRFMIDIIDCEQCFLRNKCNEKK